MIFARGRRNVDEESPVDPVDDAEFVADDGADDAAGFADGALMDADGAGFAWATSSWSDFPAAEESPVPDSDLLSSISQRKAEHLENEFLETVPDLF